MPQPPDAHVGTGAYVLDALTDDERTAFEEHLADCAACQAEVAELSEAAGRLGTAVAVEPPPRLKAQVMAAISTTRQLPPVGRHSRPGPVTEADAVAERAVPQPRYTRRNLLALAAAAVVVAGAGGIAIDQYRDASRARDEQDQIAAVLAAPDAETVRGPVQGGGRATVVSSQQLDDAVVVVSGLPAAPQGREYQLWFIESATHARSIGLLGRTPATSTVLVEGGVDQAAAFGITVEPSGGSSQPSTKPIAAIPMT